ncbi:ankyrin repeat domain-containing protein [Streptomyces sp. NPDC058297]|uniref:ankyrin repeat domain-containing protein n=1 Tax=Streptomyces sp. NPDC058297 TaxID=3346433 RepID=UPI0036EA95D6
MAEVNSGWSGVKWADWKDADSIRRRLDQGADPEVCGGGRPLHRAAAFGSPEVVAELARRVRDVDALDDGTAALWEAVMENRPDTARALAAAGADPWRPQVGDLRQRICSGVTVSQRLSAVTFWPSSFCRFAPAAFIPSISFM